MPDLMDDVEYAKALETELHTLQADLTKARDEQQSRRQSLRQAQLERQNLEQQYAQRKQLQDLNDEMVALQEQLRLQESLKQQALEDLVRGQESFHDSVTSFESSSAASSNIVKNDPEQAGQSLESLQSRCSRSSKGGNRKKKSRERSSKTTTEEVAER